MSSHARGQRRRYRKSSGRRVWVFLELHYDLRPEQVSRIITTAGLEQAQLEAAAQAESDSRAEEKEADDA